MQTIQNIAEDVQAVITSYNQGEMVREAVDSLCNQTMLPSKIIIVDDGSMDEASIQILKEIQNDSEIPIPVCIVRQENSGVSDAYIGIVQEPLMDYRTAAASANIQSMSKRLDLMRYIIEKHHTSYQNHITEVILKMESVSMNRLYGWESEICNTLAKDQKLSDASDEFMKSPSYGDGGMAAAVRIATVQKKTVE